ADENIERGIELYQKMGPFWLNKLGPVRFYPKFALGQTQQAMQVLQGFTMSRYLKGTSFDFKISSIRAEAALRLGNLADAEQWAANWKLTPAIAVTASRELPALAYARLLMLQGQTDDALQVLGRLEQSASGGGRFKRLLKVLLLRAVLMQKCGQEKDALANLNRAIGLAAPGEYYRAFLDEPEILPLLPKSTHANSPFVLKILDFCKTDSAAHQPKGPNALSVRELELLQEMAQGLTNQEIADKLFISLNTVQWHITHMYEKLGVKNRTSAIKKAQNEHLI
ncbi:MAG: LuxR C-terminal-related transcriptional regulator, partial [Eubacteriales bacterium]